MKKFLLLILTIILLSGAKSNPVLEPPVISELYFSNGSVQVELFFQGIYAQMYWNLDDFNLASSMGAVEFNDGIEIDFDEVMVLTEADLKSVFNFNPQGDMICIEDDNGWIVGNECFVFGNYEYSSILAPTDGQSIATEGYYDPQSGYIYTAEVAIEEPNTIGSYPFSIMARGSLEGYVLDMNNNPIQWLNVYGATTDQSGYFYLPQLFCKMYDIWIKHDGNLVYTYTDTIYPDLTSFIEIHLDTILVGIPEYYNHPNPFTNLTSFNYCIPKEISYKRGFLSIYNLGGDLLKEIEIFSNEGNISWESSELNAGIYLYNIVLDNKQYATRKMIKL